MVLSTLASFLLAGAIYTCAGEGANCCRGAEGGKENTAFQFDRFSPLSIRILESPLSKGIFHLEALVSPLISSPGLFSASGAEQALRICNAESTAKNVS